MGEISISIEIPPLTTHTHTLLSYLGIFFFLPEFIVCLPIFPLILYYPPPPFISSHESSQKDVPVFRVAVATSVAVSTFNPFTTGSVPVLVVLDIPVGGHPCRWVYCAIQTWTLAIFMMSEACDFDLLLHTSLTRVTCGATR